MSVSPRISLINGTHHTKDIETNNPYAYTGRELDTDELYYYRARYYDPTLQKFISEDPIGFASGDFNWYRYVGNDPINHKDSSGLAGIKINPNNPPKPPKGTPTIKQPEFLPKIPIQNKPRIKKCSSSKICKVIKPVKYGCYAACGITLAICRLKSAE